MKRPSGFEPYCGPLTPHEVANGTEAALSNAQELYLASQALFGLRFFLPKVPPLRYSQLKKFKRYSYF